jgi:hypothetical protein
VRTWQGTARFESSAVVSAPADRAWSLLSSPEAWSLDGSLTCVFEIPARLPSARPDQRLWFCLSGDEGGVTGVPMEVAAPASSRQLEVRAGSGQRTWLLSAEPARRGTKLRIRGTAQTRREQVVEGEAQLRAGLAHWLEQVRAVLDGRRPWPGPGVPGPLRSAALAVPQPQGAMEAAVAVDVAVPAAATARLLRAPVVVAAIHAAGLARSPHTLWIGAPPGDKSGEVGALGCILARTAEGALAGTVSVCIGSSAAGYVVRQLRWPYDEIARTVTATRTGSRLELRERFLPREPEVPPEEIQARARGMLTSLAASVRTAIEEAAAREAGL